MTNRTHPNRSQRRHIKLSRGFANEQTYYSVLPKHQAEAEAWADDLTNNTNTPEYAEWTADPEAQRPGVALRWEEHRHALLGTGYGGV